MTITITAFEHSPDGGRGLARDTRVRWALEEVRQPYKVRAVSFRAMKEPAYLALHPFGQIPTFEEGDLALFETGSIVLHIAERHSGLLPGDPNARARAITWMFAAVNTVEPPILELQNAKLLEPAQVETLLKNSARAFPSTPSQPIGTGIVNAKAAVDAALGGGSNTAPVANFSFTTSGLTASFTDSSTDSDGTIASRSWNFGDGTTSTATSPSKTYTAAGTYTVTLTVTDNGGATNTKTSSVTVTAGGGGGTVLSNGVAVTGLTATTGNSLNYTMVVPAGATNLVFTTSGGTGDVDMYVKSGSAPTDTVYDCRPYSNGNAETCTFATPAAGTYYVRLKAYSTFSGVSLVGSYTAGGGGGTPQTYTNTTDYAIADNATVNSPITVSGRSGNGAASTPVAVNIVHTYKGDLKVDLVAPDGSVYVLHNRAGGSADNIVTTYTVNLSSEALNGTWNLRVNDNAGGDTGYINSWSVTF